MTTMVMCDWVMREGHITIVVTVLLLFYLLLGEMQECCMLNEL